MPERDGGLTPEATQERELEATTGLRASVSLLRCNRDFRRLFFASVISLGGDWFLFVAITSLIVESSGRAIDVGFAVLAQELAFFLASPPAGVLVDRLDRRRLMIVCDLARIGIALSFLFVDAATIWLAYPLLALMSVFAAPFDPASTAATPNLVEPSDLPTANALNGSVWGTMLAVGAGIGGVVAAVFGRDVAFSIDAATFAISAVLLWGIRRPFSEPREPGHEHPRMVEATTEVVRYAGRDHRVLALMAVKAGFGLAAGVLALIPVFGADVFVRGEIGV
ncbi:MAG TPA: MFS transporter, partial [Candidatus Limnocylindrales bacterium]|nr:MFS transporter [Candidatus Limnocylindrales bacterium]